MSNKILRAVPEADIIHYLESQLKKRYGAKWDIVNSGAPIMETIFTDGQRYMKVKPSDDVTTRNVEFIKVGHAK